MARPKEIMDQETLFLSVLQTTATYRIEDTLLELRTSDSAGGLAV
jgi:hypothetical protein